MLLNVNNPSTVYIQFSGCPRYFCVYDEKGRIYYFRFMDGKTPRIKFNIPDPGKYTGDRQFMITRIVDIELPASYPELPPAERDRWKDVTFVYNPELKGTPARIFTETGVIEHSPQWYSYPPPIRLFLDLHEMGHMLYKTEMYCDLYALVNFLRMGYNRSTAYYAMDKILSRSQENIDRIKFLLTQIVANGDEFKPY